MRQMGTYYEPLLIDEKDAAQLLSVSVAALRRWRYQGRGLRVIRIERCVRYSLSEIQALAAAPTRVVESA